jgi:hypothetical protein
LAASRVQSWFAGARMVTMAAGGGGQHFWWLAARLKTTLRKARGVRRDLK